MKQSQLFTKTRKEAPKDEVSSNASLLIRAGFIHKEMAGVYSYLPLGLRVLERINTIIREEMDKVGGQEILLTALQEKELWEKTDRWDDEKVDNWFKTKLKNETDVGLGFTHEEPLTKIMSEYIRSFRDLPKLVYQIQTKFRNETRAKSGLLRGREFLMKDMYSFAATERDHEALYNSIKGAYRAIFERVGVADITVVTFASGGVFSKYSEEFQTISEEGEDIIYVDTAKKIAVNREVYNDEVLKDLDLDKDSLEEKKAIETGNIFTLGTRFSNPLELRYIDEEGNEKDVIMGSYGLGPSRLMGTIAEVCSDTKGIVWPMNVSPFKYHLLNLNTDDTEVSEYAESLYKKLSDTDGGVLYDDRDARAGEKFADSDLIGIPVRVVVSSKTLKEGKVEIKLRNEEKSSLASEADLLNI